jgi:hypothetical protein
MADPEHLNILKSGVENWNNWRNDFPDILPNLRKAKLQGMNLQNANFNDTNLRRTNLSNANLTGATFRRADLRRADLSGANLQKADLTSATLIETNLQNSTLDSCLVYGVSAWNNELEGATQRNLIISKKNSPTLTVDNLEVAQFVYLLINNQKIRDVIDTIGQKSVLILGRFSPPERKEVLDSMSEKLRTSGFLPIIFDFEGSSSRDFTETIQILAGLSLFVIVDITNPKSSPLELQAVVPDYKIPFVTIIEKGQEPFSMFKDLTIYDWVLKPVISYSSIKELIDGFELAIVKRAIEKHVELTSRKTEELKTTSIDDLIKKIKP